MIHLENIIEKPLITEKVSLESETNNRYGFVVHSKANKFQIKSAVEKLFDVKVLNVRTSITAGKTQRFGKNVKKRQSVKRAYVQIKDGQKIEFFKGV